LGKSAVLVIQPTPELGGMSRVQDRLRLRRGFRWAIAWRYKVALNCFSAEGDKNTFVEQELLKGGVWPNPQVLQPIGTKLI
jgi:hypothetical protein